MAGRVSPSERLHSEIDELFASDCELALILEGVARLSVRLMKQAALEAEINAFLGRARYQRGTDDGRPGSRKGWQPPASVKSTMGPETRDYRSVSAASRRRRAYIASSRDSYCRCRITAGCCTGPP